MSSPKYFAPVTPEKPKRIVRGRKIVLVEGADECWMFDHMFEQMGLSEEVFQILDFNGKTNLAENIDNLISQDPFLDDEIEALAVVIDADQAFAKTLYDLNSAFTSAGLAKPPLGSFKKTSPQSRLHVGAYIMPDNGGAGALETLLMASVAGGETAAAADKFVTDHAPPKIKDVDKRRSQIYLAAQKTLSRGAGWGARQGYFDLSAACMASLVGFVENLRDV